MANRAARRKFRPTKRQRKNPDAFKLEVTRRAKRHRARMQRRASWLKKFVRVMSDLGRKFGDVERAAMRLRHELVTP